jgi:predicted aspartyl protease
MEDKCVVFGGIGMTLKREGGYTIKADIVYSNEPAAIAGIVSGDTITMVDGEPTYGLKMEQTVTDASTNKTPLDMTARCSRVYVESTTESPAVASTPTNSLPIILNHSGAYMTISVGSIPITMLIDTGASAMTVSETVAERLIAVNQAIEGSDSETKYMVMDRSERHEPSLSGR